MDRATVISKLLHQRHDLETAGILSLSVFGSVARGDERQTSDIDLLAEFDPVKIDSLLQVVHLRDMLSETLGETVDLSSRAWLRESVRDQVQREAVVVF